MQTQHQPSGMISDRRGDIGFLEALVATMAVIMVLTAFTGFLAAMTLEDAAEIPGFDRNAADGITIADRAYTGDLGSALQKEMDRWGYAGITVRCYAPGSPELGAGIWSLGALTGGIAGDRWLADVKADDGTVVPTVFEVAVCA